MSSYVSYYQRTINEHSAGLKLVLGGTGLGKTSSLATLLNSGDYPADVKFIYVANRIQLLDEMAALVEDAPRYAHQRKDADQLALADAALTELLSHASTPALLVEHRRLEQLPATSLEDLRGKIQRFKQARALGGEIAELVNVSELASDTLRPLKQLLALARQLATSAPLPQQEITQRQAQTLADLPVWPLLFPYIRFQADPDCRLLLLTVQKAFHGVFDGQRAVRLGRWSAQPDWRYVFVIDEFDFLENDLLGLLAEDREVRDPFGLVQTFYERLCRRKLRYPNYMPLRPEWQAIKSKMEEIQARIDLLEREYGIDFPTITHFATTEHTLHGRAIFQSNRSLVARPVYLDPAAPRPYSFTLTEQPGGHSAFLLFDVVTRAVKDIIRLFNELQANHEGIYWEVLRQCFGGTEYLNEVRQVNQIGAQHELYETNYGNLLANGFGMYEIETQRSQLTDPEEVGVLYLSLNDSPEAMIRALARQHLVFGLSATAHIQRVLRNFDWTGLAHPPGNPAGAFGPLPNTAADEADVRTANAQKAKARQNTLTYALAEPLGLATPFGKQLAALLPVSSDKPGAADFRRRRAQHFFGLLARLATLPPEELAASQTHLVFLNSFKQVKQLLDKGGDDDQWFGAKAHPGFTTDPHLQLYEVWCCDETKQRQVTANVVLYDAGFGQELQRDPARYEQYNALFWAGRPVVVVTTYPSAGNGVNLQHYQTRADWEAGRSAGKRDFRFLHLLEAPYYYFNGVPKDESAARQHAAIKRDVYGVMKLLYAKQISKAQATGMLGHIRALNRFNSQYLQTADGTLNQFSVYVQALGRIERVWQPMPDQQVWFDAAVYRTFVRLATGPDLSAECANYRRYASHNMDTLLAALGPAARQEREDLEDELHDLRPADEAARAAIEQMVLDIEQFKRTGPPHEARQRWEWLREDVLRHDLPRPASPGQDLADPLRPNQLQRIQGMFRSEYLREGQLQLNQRTLQLAPPGTAHPDFAAWDLNAVYRPITRFLDSALATHFRVRGYELAFVESGTYLLPYVYQSILVGAVGEELIEAVLKMKGIAATGRAVPDAVFEVADLKVKDRPVYIDCKNYGPRTQRQFALPPEDPLYHPKLNEVKFKERMVSKWQQLQRATPHTPADPCRLLVMNLLQDEESALNFYDEQFRPVPEWALARIVVLTGTLKADPADKFDLLTEAALRLMACLTSSQPF